MLQLILRRWLRLHPSATGHVTCGTSLRRAGAAAVTLGCCNSPCLSSSSSLPCSVQPRHRFCRPVAPMRSELLQAALALVLGLGGGRQAPRSSVPLPYLHSSINWLLLSSLTRPVPIPSCCAFPHCCSPSVWSKYLLIRSLCLPATAEMEHQPGDRG